MSIASPLATVVGGRFNVTILEASKVASESKRIDCPGDSHVYPGGGVGLGANAPSNPNFANPQVNDSRSIRQINADALHVETTMVPNNCQGQERVKDACA